MMSFLALSTLGWTLSLLLPIAAALPPQQPLVAPDTSFDKPSNLPLILWHGLGDKCDQVLFLRVELLILLQLQS